LFLLSRRKVEVEITKHIIIIGFFFDTRLLNVFHFEFDNVLIVNAVNLLQCISKGEFFEVNW